MKIYFIFLLFAFSSAFAQVKHLDSTLTYRFLSPKDSIIIQKSIYSYDANKKLSLILQDTFDVAKNKLYVFSKTQYQYDADGNQTLFLYSLWRPLSNDWYVQTKIESSFENNRINYRVLNFDNNNDTLSMYTGIIDRYDKKELEYSYLFFSLNSRKSGNNVQRNYNSKGKIVSQVNLFWDTTINTWKKSIKTEYLYDNSDKLIEEINYTGNNANTAWLNKEMKTYRYDNASNLIEQVTYTRNNANTAWLNKEKLEYSFDNNNNRVLYISSVWNTTYLLWEGKYKTESTFNDKNKEVIRISYIARPITYVSDINDWDRSFKNKEEYTYDEKGNIISDAAYNWEQISTSKVAEWIVYSKREYTYNSDKKITSFVNYSRNNVNALVPNNKTDFTYDFNGNFASRLNTYWDSKNSEWKNGSKIEQNLDVEGSILFSAYYTWNNDLNLWQGLGDKIENTFDERGETSNKLYSWNLTNNSWQKYMQKYFFYEKDLSNNAHLSELSLSEGTLDVTFNSEVFTYRINNLFKVPSIVAVPASKKAIVKIESPKNILSDNEADRTATIKVTAEDGKTTLTYYLIFSKVITSTEVNDTHIQVYPNPSSNRVVINTESVSPFSIRIIDMKGVLLEQIKDIRDKQTELSLENYTKGTYIIEVSDGLKLLYRKKIIFQ